MSDRAQGLGWRTWLALYIIGLLAYGLAAIKVSTPGYMDADYYFVTAGRLQAGQGLTEPFLWNYLDDPQGIPHPSHLYWMPLPSFIASGGMEVLGPGFRSAQLPFILIAAFLPPLAAYYCWQLTKEIGLIWMAALFAAFPGFFLPFLVTTDSFALFAITASLALWVLGGAVRSHKWWSWLVGGLLIGIGSLARADGMLLLLPALLAVIWSRQRRLVKGASLAAGFLAVMGPWWLRNLSEIGVMLNPGSGRLLWMLAYDDLFAYPADQLTFQRWLQAGMRQAFASRLVALGTNLQRLVAEGGLIFLAPFMIVGAARKWGRLTIRLTVIYLAALFLVFTFVFPFIGPRGALFHSMAGVMPLLWALAPLGLRVGIEWLGRKRRWKRRESWRVLGIAAVALAALLTIGLYANRFLATDDQWNASASTYAAVADLLPNGEGELVAVNNPPGLVAHSHQKAVVIPNGPVNVLREVSDRYGVHSIVLEANHPEGLAELYAEPEAEQWLRLVETLEDAAGRPVHVLEVLR